MVANNFLGRWPDYWSHYLASGLTNTLGLWAVATVLTLVWAVPVAVLRGSPVGPLRWLAMAYIELFRGTPQLVQILGLFAALPILTGILVPPWPTAIIALTLNAGSYMAESYRSGFQAIPRGQVEAAESLGMTRLRVWRRVVFPQAVRIIQPTIGTITVAILMTTAFVYLVGVVDLMAQANNAQIFSVDFSVFYLVALIYAAMALLATGANALIERRLRLP
jgi:His/Glu/Gln/Arg/opine family amino acid ABC transporter permease subunit